MAKNDSDMVERTFVKGNYVVTDFDSDGQVKGKRRPKKGEKIKLSRANADIFSQCFSEKKIATEVSAEDAEKVAASKAK